MLKSLLIRLPAFIGLMIRGEMMSGQGGKSVSRKGDEAPSQALSRVKQPQEGIHETVQQGGFSGLGHPAFP
jgi:hypothetical protein